MCGRYTIDVNGEPLPLGWAEFTRVIRMTAIQDMAEHLPPRFNVAPMQRVPILRVASPDAPCRLAMVSWGLVPSWAKDPSSGPRPLNARADTAAEKPTFRAALRRRRCLIPASGFYEWKPLDAKQKQPVYFRIPARPLFAFAGLWERWEGTTGQVLESCTILTTEANDLVAPIHDRMPVILRPDDYERWMDPAIQDPEAVLAIALPYPAEEMAVHHVSARVGSVSNDGPELVLPVPPEPRQMGLFP